MATNFTNKYMQVFQDYNEFSEHSADYVRGEDHIAFLIEENEVIYWLYLEQVWRPLNVRTTTTGQLEDGRTKVAVRLEYIEGGQKYTSVPNIPDPERITSMSHFLEDYPDIEEVNVSGTVNLTDLSYAFAGSKIKDFSLLNIDNVDDYSHFIDNINNASLDINLILTDNTGIKSFNGINENFIINSFVFNNTKGANQNNGSFKFYNATIKNIDFIRCNSFYDNDEDGDCINLTLNNCVSNEVKGSDITIENECNINDVYISYKCTLYADSVLENSTINVKEYIEEENHKNKILTTFSLQNFDGNGNVTINYKAIIDTERLILYTYNNKIPNAKFGYGIKYNGDDIIISNKYTIGNFIFTTPIVDDAFYAKYNRPISIFQYKTTFTEVADVNISSEVNSSLLYIDWWNVDWDTSNMSIELHNYMPNDNAGIGIQDTFFNLNGKTFNKFILDNTDIANENNLPNLCFQNVFFELNTTEPSYIRGKYKLMNSGGYARYRHTNMFNNLVLYSDIAVDIKSLRNNPFLTADNVVIKAPSFIITNVGNSGKIEIANLVNDNNELYISYYNNYPNYLIKDKACTLHVSGLLCSFYDWFIGTTINTPIYIDGETNFYLYITYSNDNYINYYKEKSVVDNLFIECNDNCFIGRIDILEYDTDENIINHGCVVKNMYGIVNVTLPYYEYIYNAGNIIYNEDTFESIYHIDVKSSRCITSNSFITSFKNLDNETLINLITKLINNDSGYSRTIYMYRFQSDIIGEENIASAVAKNYEFAIIEN